MNLTEEPRTRFIGLVPMVDRAPLAIGLFLLFFLIVTTGCLPVTKQDTPQTTEVAVVEQETSCRSGNSEPTRFESERNHYTVSGSLSIPNPCHSLEVDSSRDGRTLTLTLDTRKKSGTCVMCVGRMDYTLRFRTPAEKLRVLYKDRILVEKNLKKNRD